MNRTLVCGLLLLLLNVSVNADASKGDKTVSIAVLSTGPQQSAAFSKWFNQFETAYPRVQLHVDFYSNENYKAQVVTWLEQGRYDLLYWQGGKRLQRLVRQGLLTPVSSVIDERTIQSSLPDTILQQVTYNNLIQALPFAQYAWGFYYNKAVFQELGLSPPTTWEEFVLLCDTLKQNGITPLIQANHQSWPLLAWLDYLSLLAGGQDLRDKIINGTPLEEAPKHTLLSTLRWLVESDLFFASDHIWRWQQTLPLIARKQAAMTLMGQFAESTMTEEVADKLGFFMFPKMSEAGTEISPMEVFVISSASHQKQMAKLFLQYLMSPSVQLGLPLDLGLLPVRFDILPEEVVGERQKMALGSLAQSKTLKQYFDREAPVSISTAFGNSLVESVATGSIAPFEQALLDPVAHTDIFAGLKTAGNRKYLSSLQGHKGTFLASRVLRLAYKQLGYDISVMRFPSLEAGLKAQNYGMDGELVRIKDYENLSDQLIRVPEPLFNVKMYIVFQDFSCAQPRLGSDNPSSSLPELIGVSSDALILQQWAKQQEIKLQRFGDEHQMWKAFHQRQIKGLVALEAGLTEHVDSLGDACYAEIGEMPLFHYVNKRNKELVPALNEVFVRLKSSDEYLEILKQFGLGVLDRPYR